MHTCTLIVGAGLAGLALAERLHAVGEDYLLVEAQSRLGGRILSHVVDGALFDLGPTWFWQEQPRMERLLARLGLERFDQYCSGDARFENQDGVVQSFKGAAPMQGSFRIVGGTHALVAALAGALPPERMLHAQLQRLELGHSDVTATFDAQGKALSIEAERVVLALPPRLADSTLAFSPQLPAQARAAMAAMPTWMAGHAKVVAVYERPFWRDAGLSGDAMSYRGPLVEIHDASPSAGGPYALFGFVGVAPEVRAAHKEEVEEMARLQLVRLFGNELERPLSLKLQDWAQEPFTATPADSQALRQHPKYGLPRALQGLWNSRLFFGSTEVSPQFGGYLEGALEAAEIVLGQLGLG